jgi:hypothetical protein
LSNVHKDFHGALSYGIQFLVEQYGEEGLREFIGRLADTVYAPLVADLKARGLIALEEHWRRVFDLEEGEYRIEYGNDELIFSVQRCPAVSHMQAQGYAVAPHFCEHTRIVNEAVCERAGYRSSVEYDQSRASCVQRFRKAPA